MKRIFFQLKRTLFNSRVAFSIFLLTLLFSIILTSPACTTPTSHSTSNASNEPTTKILLQNLDTPWAIDFLPNEEIIFTQRGGKISLYDSKEEQKEPILLKEIEVSEVAESGLLGIATDPEFTLTNHIYVYYTHPNRFNRISRFILKENTLTDETILLDNIPSAQYHDGGRIKFGPDGKLYITTGDATIPSTAQDINSLAGKILRMNKDGSIPTDNPFANYVWSYGHRNPQGLAWKEGILYASEHGQSKNDEINIITKGSNYGWPNQCTDQGKFTQPLRCFTEFTLAPSGITFFNGNLYIAGLRGTQVRKLTLDGHTIIDEKESISNLGRIREIVEHNGYLYIATSNKDGRGIAHVNDDKIIRVKI